MPFQPLPEENSVTPHSSDLALLLTRILTTLVFLYYQLMDQLNLVRRYLWEKAEWSLVSCIEDLGLPVPGVISITVILLLTVSFLGIAAGVFTRLNSWIGFLLIGCVLFMPLDLSQALSPQSLVLYLIIFLFFALSGGGRFTLDQYFSSKKTNK